MHLSRIFIADGNKIFLKLLQIQNFFFGHMNPVFLISFKRQTIVHAAIQRRYDGKRFLFQQPFDNFQPFFDNRLSVHIRTVKDEILRRIIHDIVVVKFQIFHKFLGPHFIVCDNKPDSLIAPCPIDHMALLGIHTSDQLNRKFTLFYPAYELVIFFQFPKRGK